MIELSIGCMAESRDEKILRAIIDLITTEKVKVSDVNLVLRSFKVSEAEVLSG